MGFSDSSLLSKIALGVVIAAFLFDIIGFPSNDWLTSPSALGTASIGLFRQCIVGVCTTFSTNIALDWWTATQAMEVMGFLCGLACLILVIIYVVVKNGVKILHIAALATAFAAAFFILVGCIIFGAKYNKGNIFSSSFKLGWSFALTIIGSLLYLGVGVILVVEKVL